MKKIGFGGSCHWCTEAIFSSLHGVSAVEQGWIASEAEDASFSEAVIVSYNAEVVNLKTLVAVHLYTHSCTSEHIMRTKYRSAIYVLTDEDRLAAMAEIRILQLEFSKPVITRVLPFKSFKSNTTDYLNYYYKDPAKPFCENIVNPKLRLLLQKFKKETDISKLQHLL
jgi:peptide-methionine (S)-S-oxide reductase